MEPTRSRYMYLAAMLLVAWCTMTFTHELGHIVCGWSCGGRLTSVELRPWRLPYSLFEPDPCPLITLWGGPILGVVIPILAALSLRRSWAWFIAYFCVLANGVYLAVAWASGDRYLDTPQLLSHGAHPATVAVYCVLTIVAGYVGFRHACIPVLSPASSTPRSKRSTETADRTQS